MSHELICWKFRGSFFSACPCTTDNRKVCSRAMPPPFITQGMLLTMSQSSLWPLQQKPTVARRPTAARSASQRRPETQLRQHKKTHQRPHVNCGNTKSQQRPEGRMWQAGGNANCGKPATARKPSVANWWQGQLQPPNSGSKDDCGRPTTANRKNRPSQPQTNNGPKADRGKPVAKPPAPF